MIWASRCAIAWSGFDQPAWILLGAVLDFCLGDLFWRYHPLHWISQGADLLKGPLGRMGPLGASVWLSLVVLAAFLGTTACLVASEWVSVWLFRFAIVLFTYWGFSTRNLVVKTLSIYQTLVTGHAEESRVELAQMLGHSMGRQSPREMVRSTVESVVDNLAQHIVAPLLFALIGGPAFLWLYKGLYAADWTAHKDPRGGSFYPVAHSAYRVARAVPDVLTGWAIFAVAGTEGRFRAAWESMRGDFKFPFRGYGLSQAAMAGTLGIRLGGPRLTDGVVSLVRPVGRMERTLDPSMILLAVSVMIRVTVLFGCVGAMVLVLVTGRWL